MVIFGRSAASVLVEVPLVLVPALSISRSASLTGRRDLAPAPGPLPPCWRAVRRSRALSAGGPGDQISARALSSGCGTRVIDGQGQARLILATARRAMDAR